MAAISLTNKMALEAWDSLNRADLAVNKIKRIDEKDWIPGAGLTTGICAAFAVECVHHVRKYRDLEVLPPLICEKPSEGMKYKEMLLAKSIYQTLPKGGIYSDVTFKRAELVTVALEKFAAAIQSETGVVAIDELDKKKDISLKDIEKPFLELSEGEYFVLFNQEYQHLTESHAIYINFNEGVIGNAGLIWKIPQKSKKYFTEIALQYIQKVGFGVVNFTKIEKVSRRNSCGYPLVLKKVALYSTILYHVARTEGMKECGKKAALFVTESASVRKATSIAIPIVKAVGSLLCNVWHGANALLAIHAKQKALMKACKEGNLFKVKLLVKMGADLNKKEDGYLPLEVVFNQNGHSQLIKFLVTNGAKSKYALIFSMAGRFVGKKEVEYLKLLLDHHFDPNDYEFISPLAKAINAFVREQTDERLEMLKLLKNAHAKLGGRKDLAEVSAAFGLFKDPHVLNNQQKEAFNLISQDLLSMQTLQEAMLCAS